VTDDLTWSQEASPTWDADKQRVIGSAPAGALDVPYVDGDALPGDWWAARTSDGVTVGYGWLDATWGGDAEILLAVDASAQRQGVGSFVIAHLEDEAARRGLNYVYNTVRDTHPQRDDLHDWLAVRGYRGSQSGGGDTTLRKRVGVDEQPPAVHRAPSSPAQPGPSRAYDPAADGDRAPGHEESGGYVDVEDHQY
jgi:GNAT superfamily N-acetyltransferase